MKVGILTWYKALNHGAVLQAYASQQVLKSLECDPVMLQYNRIVRKENLLYKLKTLKRYMSNGMLKYRYKWLEFDEEKQIGFNNFIKNNICEGDYYDREVTQASYIGSDMVFNLKQGYSSYMFGYNLKSNYIFAYAASAGGTTEQLAEKMMVRKEIRNGLAKFDGIGCRDKETVDFVKNIYNEADVVMNIDPVLLYGFNKEKEKWDTKKWKSHKPYILIYSYHSHMDTKKEVEIIREYAKDRKLQIVSCGYYHPWCDENINCDPCEFLEMFVNADYVITDTFHGTVFSLICRKQFVSILRDNSFKVGYLLKDTKLENRIATNISEVSEILSETVDYLYFEKWLEREKNNSLGYISSQLANAKNRS